LRSEWKWSDGYFIYGRIENALNDHYQTSTGKSTPGRQVTVGIRVDL
jgi:outer membrane cobalamin receptor